jgi:hypothetical protein
MTGLDAAFGANRTPIYGSDVLIGVMNITTAQGGPTTFVLNYDENDLGNFIPHSTNTDAGIVGENGTIISFDPNTGRGELFDGPTPGTNPPKCGGFSAGFVNSAVVYLYDAGRGFIIDTDISTPTPPVGGTPPPCPITNNAFSGTLTPQALPTGPSPGQFAVTDFLAGNMIAQFGASASPNVPNAALTFNVDGTGGYTAGGDVTSLDTQGGNLPDVSFTGKSGNVSISDSPPTTPVLGRGALQVPPGLFGDFNPADQKFPFLVVIYVVDHNQFVGIGFNSGFDSGLMFFDPQ